MACASDDAAYVTLRHSTCAVSDTVCLFRREVNPKRFGILYFLHSLFGLRRIVRQVNNQLGKFSGQLAMCVNVKTRFHFGIISSPSGRWVKDQTQIDSDSILFTACPNE